MVTVTIENISGQEIDLKSLCSFELLSMSKEAVTRAHRVFGDSYWGPVNMSDGTPLRLEIIDPKKQEKGIVEGRVPKASLHFTKNELKTFKVDLTKLHWNASMGSDWPSWSLFEVVEKGPYALVFRYQGGGVNVKSNEIKVRLNE